MTLERIIGKIPLSSWKETSETLIDIVLNSPDASGMPSKLAKTILYYWQQGQLATEVGLPRLLEASIIVNLTGTFEALEALGHKEIVAELKNKGYSTAPKVV